MKKFNYLFLFIMMICLCSCSNSNLKYDVRYHWEIDESGAIVNKEEHTFSDWYVIEESTCIVAGTQQRKCTVCSYKEIEELELIEHEEVVTKQGIPPTFYEDGITVESEDKATEIILGYNIKQATLKKQLTQEELSKLTNIDQSDISKIEKGILCPTLSTIKKIARGLNEVIRVNVF